MIPPKIAALPPAPVRSDAPVDFSTKADAMVGALQPFANQANILAEFVNTRAENAESSATTVEGVQAAVSADRVLSQQAASNAAGSAAAAASSASTANSRATAAQSSANASEASAVRAEAAAEYVEGIGGGAAPVSNPNFKGTVKVNNAPLGTAALKNVGTAAGDVLEVGAGGWLTAFGIELLDANTVADSMQNRTGFYGRMSDQGSANVPHPFVYLFHMFYRETGHCTQIAYGYNTPKIWVRYRCGGKWMPWAECLTNETLLTTTGQSTQFPMTQKATTDAIANIPSVPKSAAYTVTAADKGKSIDTTTNVTIPASVFAVGDVIVVTNTSATNSSITPADGVTIRLAGTTSTGTRTLAGYGVATLRMASNNVWFASGAGLS